MSYKQGDIFMVEFPFTMGTSSKKRPAIVISNEELNSENQDVILAQVTSRPKYDKYSYKIEQSNLSNDLPRQSQVRCHKIFTFLKSNLGEKKSSLNEDGIRDLRQNIIKFL